LSDNRSFSREDLVKHGTARRLTDMKDLLRRFYTPCKARVYLDQHVSEKRCVTILKHLLRTRDMMLLSREKNVGGKKITFYQIINRGDVEKLHHMTKSEQDAVWISFGDLS